ARLVRLPDELQARSGIFDKVLAAYSCGGSRGFAPRSLFLALIAQGSAPDTASGLLRFRGSRKAGAFGGQAFGGLGDPGARANPEARRYGVERRAVLQAFEGGVAEDVLRAAG